jgi:hypothetical protein
MSGFWGGVECSPANDILKFTAQVLGKWVPAALPQKPNTQRSVWKETAFFRALSGWVLELEWEGDLRTQNVSELLFVELAIFHSCNSFPQHGNWQLLHIRQKPVSLLWPLFEISPRGSSVAHFQWIESYLMAHVALLVFPVPFQQSSLTFPRPCGAGSVDLLSYVL